MNFDIDDISHRFPNVEEIDLERITAVYEKSKNIFKNAPPFHRSFSKLKSLKISVVDKSFVNLLKKLTIPATVRLTFSEKCFPECSIF